MSDLIVGTAIAALALAVIVPPAVLVARWQDRRQDRRQASARHCLRRPHPAVVLARDLLGLLPPAPAPATWERIRAGMSRPPRYVDTSRTLAEMNGPIVTEAEVDEEWQRRPLAAKPWALTDDDIREQWERARVELPLLLPLRPCCPTTAAEAHRSGCEGARRPVNGRYLGTQPRRTPYPSAADPVTPAQTDDDPPWSIETAQQDAVPAYGVDRCELDVDEARRHYALALGPDGCEET